MHLPLITATLAEGPFHKHCSTDFFKCVFYVQIILFALIFQDIANKILLPSPDYLASDFPLIFAALDLSLSHKFQNLYRHIWPCPWEIVSELFFLRYNSESATQRPFSTSCLWRLREIRWWRIRWRSRTLAVLVLLSSRFVSFRRQGTLFCGRGWRSTSIAKFIFECLFLFDLFAFLWSEVLLSLYRFPETPLDAFPVPTYPWSLLVPMREGHLISFSERTCFLSPSSLVSVAL